MKCHRIGCLGEGKRGVRDRSGSVLVFCPSCFQELIRSNVIDRETGQVMAS